MEIRHGWTYGRSMDDGTTAPDGDVLGGYSEQSPELLPSMSGTSSTPNTFYTPAYSLSETFYTPAYSLSGNLHTPAQTPEIERNFQEPSGGWGDFDPNTEYLEWYPFSETDNSMLDTIPTEQDFMS